MIATVQLFDRLYDVEVKEGKLILLKDSCFTQIDLKKDPFVMNIQSQLDEYERGDRTQFELNLELNGTDFQLKVWKALTKIPYGKMMSYQEMAQAIGHPKAARAVGQACHKNPIGIIVPCHRVIGSNHQLTGYAGGLDLKEKLLRHEKALI